MSQAKIEINVLLLGEIEVGKSTFINAFVNYLVFDTLQQAEQSEPVALIPISFLTTIGHNFEEVIVEFGDVDPNEDHEHPGQSVTQQCKSYLFDLNDRIRLRLIDSPGMGDTRGAAQDDKNIEHILTYINILPHLNAVCLLLKPNASQLNVFFRSCVDQLFTYLTPLGYNNVIFCFTNARATFYAPGDTGPLLRKMLNKGEKNDIPLGKANTFCFDSESFRYLAARKYGVTFDDFQKDECTNSWTKSVNESVRLLKHILTREVYHLNVEQSPGKAVLEIIMLARPLMETLRLIAFNWVLHKTDATANRIELSSSPVRIEICSNCASSEIVQVKPLSLLRYQWILPKTDAIQHHQCTFDGTKFLIEYTLKYEFVDQPLHSKQQLRTILDDMLLKCNKLTHFFQQQTLSVGVDPFASVLERMINEEEQISYTPHDDVSLNRSVCEVLNYVRESRVKNTERLKECNERLSLNAICRIIEELKDFNSINEQIASIVKSRQIKMKASEHRLETKLIKNNTFYQLINNSSQ